MLEMLRITGVLLAAPLAFPAFAGPPGGAATEIDCDRGGDLQRAVDTLANRGGGTLHVSGTCDPASVGSGYVEILGDSPATSRIEAGPGPAVVATGPGQLTLRKVHLSGGTGIQASGNDRAVFVHDAEIRAMLIGVRADAGAGIVVADSDVTGVEFGIQAQGGIVVVERSVVHDSNFGARVFDAELFFQDVEVTDSATVGIQALDRSTVSIAGGRFLDNGNAHLSVTSDSRLEAFNVRIGNATDPTHLALQANHSAKVGLFADDPAAEIWRGANVRGDSYLHVEGVTFHGSINLRSFSRLLLNGTVADGNVNCDSAADAVCEHAATAATSGCKSAPASCTP